MGLFGFSWRAHAHSHNFVGLLSLVVLGLMMTALHSHDFKRKKQRIIIWLYFHYPPSTFCLSDMKLRATCWLLNLNFKNICGPLAWSPDVAAVIPDQKFNHDKVNALHYRQWKSSVCQEEKWYTKISKCVYKIVMDKLHLG